VVQAAQYIRFNLGGGVTYVQSHLVSAADACNPDVTDKTSQFDAKVGIGAGVRYRSPVGPLQLDLAYGLDKKALRLHLSVGFTF